MGWFDPPHKKLLAKTSERFQKFAPQLNAVIDRAIYEKKIGIAHSAFRTLVLARLANSAAVSRMDEWTEEGMDAVVRAMLKYRSQLAPWQLDIADELIGDIIAGNAFNPTSS